MEQLPSEIIHTILLNLNLTDILSIITTNKYFNNFRYDEYFWNLKIQKDFNIEKTLINNYEDTYKFYNKCKRESLLSIDCGFTCISCYFEIKFLKFINLIHYDIKDLNINNLLYNINNYGSIIINNDNNNPNVIPIIIKIRNMCKENHIIYKLNSIIMI